LLSVAFWMVAAGFLRVAIIPPESCGDTERASIASAAIAARDWIVRNQHPDGSYTYLYVVDADTQPNEYNLVRHAGVTMSLYQAAGFYADQTTLDAADAGLDWLIQRLESRHGWSAPVLRNDEISLGSAALMAVGLAERRLVTGDRQYDGLMHEVGRFLLALQRDDGGFNVGYSRTADAPVTGRTSKYYPGESLWALALLAEAFPDEGWDVAARKALDFLVTKRDEVDDVSYPPFPDQWLAYGLAEMSEWGLNDDALAYARRLAGRFGLFVRTAAQREGSAIGRLTRGRKARAAGLGTWVEGLSSFWRLASTEDDLADLESKIKERLVCSAGILTVRQANEAAAAASRDPALVEGAWISRGETRMDDQQHALSGLLYTLNAIDGKVERVAALPVLPRP
jgi:hypothetical protein